ncbi:hypothetical protein LCGC14_2341710, partial [marine sediment metagenome]
DRNNKKDKNDRNGRKTKYGRNDKKMGPVAPCGPS